MKPQLFKHLHADGFYAVRADGEYVGDVRKCYTGRSSYLWTVAPVGYVEKGRSRAGYSTRRDAVQALVDYHRTGKHSLVEG